MNTGYIDSAKAKAITWGELVEREPRLADVLAAAQAAKPTCKKEWRRFDYAHEFSILRRRFEELVGWYRRPHDSVLSSGEAWQVVCDRILDELCDP